MANCVYVMEKCWVCISSPSLAVAGENGERQSRESWILIKITVGLFVTNVF